MSTSPSPYCRLGLSRWSSFVATWSMWTTFQLTSNPFATSVGILIWTSSYRLDKKVKYWVPFQSNRLINGGVCPLMTFAFNVQRNHWRHTTTHIQFLEFNWSSSEVIFRSIFRKVKNFSDDEICKLRFPDGGKSILSEMGFSVENWRLNIAVLMAETVIFRLIAYCIYKYRLRKLNKNSII